MASNRANGNEEFVEVERSTEVDAAAKEEQADSAAKGEEAESKSPIHKLAEQLTIEAERLAEGLTEEAKREAEKEASRIIADAELKAREQILEPALTEAAAKSRAIIAKAAPSFGCPLLLLAFSSRPNRSPSRSENSWTGS